MSNNDKCFSFSKLLLQENEEKKLLNFLYKNVLHWDEEEKKSTIVLFFQDAMKKTEIKSMRIYQEIKEEEHEEKSRCEHRKNQTVTEKKKKKEKNLCFVREVFFLWEVSERIKLESASLLFFFSLSLSVFHFFQPRILRRISGVEQKEIKGKEFLKEKGKQMEEEKYKRREKKRREKKKREREKAQIFYFGSLF